MTVQFLVPPGWQRNQGFNGRIAGDRPVTGRFLTVLTVLTGDNNDNSDNMAEIR